MNEWFEKRLPVLLCLKTQRKLQEINGALHMIEYKKLTLTYFGSQFDLQFSAPPGHIILSFRMETLHFKDKLMLSDVGLTEAKKSVSRFNQAAAVKACF